MTKTSKLISEVYKTDESMTCQIDFADLFYKTECRKDKYIKYDIPTYNCKFDTSQLIDMTLDRTPFGVEIDPLTGQLYGESIRKEMPKNDINPQYQ